MADASHFIEIGTPVSCGSCAALGAIREALALLDAIGQGGLFDVALECENDRRRHATGLALLELLESRLSQVTGSATHLGSISCHCGSARSKRHLDL